MKDSRFESWLFDRPFWQVIGGVLLVLIVLAAITELVTAWQVKNCNARGGIFADGYCQSVTKP